MHHTSITNSDENKIDTKIMITTIETQNKMEKKITERINRRDEFKSTIRVEN